MTLSEEAKGAWKNLIQAIRKSEGVTEEVTDQDVENLLNRKPTLHDQLMGELFRRLMEIKRKGKEQ